MIRVLNVNSTLGLRAGGGTAERTFQMSRHQAIAGMQVTVLTLDLELDESRRLAVAPATVVTLPCLWARFYVPRGGWKRIKALVHEADIVHLMGHWSVLNIMAYMAAKSAGVPYAVCPAGALSLFGRSAFIKRIYNAFIGKAMIRDASAWIAVTESEFPQYEDYGIAQSQVVVISNGVSAEDFPQTGRGEFLARFNLPDAPLILFMGRLNPIKGPDLLLSAYLKIQQKIPDHHLVFAGPDGGLLAKLREVAVQADMSDRVHFIGYVGGKDKSSAYHHASLLVVPSRQEAMSIVALEAGICGTPALLTDQCGFGEVREIDARLEVPATVEGLADGMVALLNNSDTLGKISIPWHQFVEARYSWRNIVVRYVELYRSILDGTKLQ